MSLSKHLCSVGLGMKLASLMSAPEVHDITTMDRLTSSEFIRLILQESSPANSDKLSNVLLLIFKSCMAEVPKAKDLKVPLKKIHPDTRIKAFQHIEDEATLIPLYDTCTCHWNWPLPESHLDKLTTSGERSNQAGGNGSMDQGEREGEIVVESVGQPEDDIMSTNASSASSDKAPVLHEIDHDSTKPWTTEQVFASFNNLLTFALLLQKPALAQKYLTLLDDIKARWDTIKATAEVIPDALIMESETTKIEEIVSKPPHTMEDTVPNPAANIPPNLVPLIDEVPSDSLMCYLVRKDEEEYIVKDHWVLRSKSKILNEICMMEKMDGICGVPHLVEYWLMEMEPIQKQVVEQNRVLHHECSLNNAMIEDNGDGTHGMLIDWEFSYGVGGTGTVPFISWSLLFQLYLHTLDPSDECLEWYNLIKNPDRLLFDNTHHCTSEAGLLVYKWVILSVAGLLRPPQNNEESASP
ncbi:hypothetical protein BD769DRAFT_1389163 [Suillus cothurnatus]|nr:hypothetical protein BD769DRAFT_1389163 [Suillus cothurnatus]